MKKIWLLSLSVAAMLAAPGLAADAMQPKPADPAMKPEEKKMMTPASMEMPGHKMMAPGDLTWVPAPPSVPAGAKMTVLKGDPGQESMFVIRLSVPAGYQIAPHWHPAFENVTVISGEANFGLGDTFDKTKGMKLVTGGFASMPPQTRHYFWAEQDTVIQLHGVGPWQLYYVNPADDPRNAAKK